MPCGTGSPPDTRHASGSRRRRHGRGLYGVVSYGVQRRVREIGIRQALGATPGDVVRRIVGRGLALATVGTALGLAGAVAATRWLQSFLFGVSATDPATLAGVSLLLVLTAGLASWIPARRATRVDPLQVLRD